MRIPLTNKERQRRYREKTMLTHGGNSVEIRAIVSISTKRRLTLIAEAMGVSEKEAIDKLIRLGESLLPPPGECGDGQCGKEYLKQFHGKSR